MPRQFDVETTNEELVDEVLFTRAALRADPDAASLLPRTDAWLGWIDELRIKQRNTAEAVANTDAARAVANSRLDYVTSRFGDSLNLAVKKDRASARWKQFFGGYASFVEFCKQALGSQVLAVLAWEPIQDATFEPFRADAIKWARAAETALSHTAATATVRGEAALLEEKVVGDLTRERDGLHAALVNIANEKELPRGWPDTFFRVGARAKPKKSAPPSPTPPPA
jgi:hypothetical protein